MCKHEIFIYFYIYLKMCKHAISNQNQIPDRIIYTYEQNNPYLFH